MSRAYKTWAGLAVGLFLVACGTNKTTTANKDLQKDLKLAATTNLDLATQSQNTAYPLVETAKDAKQADARTLHKGAGPKAIRSKNPTVKASPDSAASPEIALPPLRMMTPTTTPTMIEAVRPGMPAATPTSDLPTPAPVRPAGIDEDVGRMDPHNTPGEGGRPGVVIRGGAPGGDNCGPPLPGGGIPIYLPPMMPRTGAGGGAPSGAGGGATSGAAPRAHGRGGL